MIQDPHIYTYNTYCTYIHYIIMFSAKLMLLLTLYTDLIGSLALPFTLHINKAIYQRHLNIKFER